MNMLAGRLHPEDGPPARLVIGLVNIMPARAAASADRNFTALLAAASGPQALDVRRFRPTEDAADLFDRLAASGADALIVTGTEPQAAAMQDERAWPLLTRLADWAADHTVATIWSCMAAHAAALHLDGVARRRLPGRLSGIYETRKVTNHALLAHAPPRWCTPHSRFNGLDEAALAGRGYQVLSWGPRTGADTVAKMVGDSLFLLVQGHPEYGPDTLLREYRRDAGRFIQGTHAAFPAVPEGYFDPATMAALAAMEQRTIVQPGREALRALDVVVPPPPGWRAQATGLFTQWLSYVACHKQARRGPMAQASQSESSQP